MKLDNRLTVILAVVIVGAVAGAGWFLGISPQLAAADGSSTQNQQVIAQNQQTEAKLAGLAKQQSRIAETKQALAALQQSVPDSSSGSALLRAIQAVADASGVTLKSFSPSAATAYVPPTTADASASSSTGSTDSSASPAATPSPTPTAAAAASTDPAIYTDSSITATNFELIKFTVAVEGTDAQTSAFLRALQSGSRLVLVTSINRVPSDGEDANDVALTVGGNAYALISSAAATTTTATTGTNG